MYRCRYYFIFETIAAQCTSRLLRLILLLSPEQASERDCRLAYTLGFAACLNKYNRLDPGYN